MAKLIIKNELCKGCGYCINFCPQRILKFDQVLNRLGYRPIIVSDDSKCITCMRCVLMCPEACIEIYE